MAFPLIGNQLTTANGVVVNLRPSLTISTVTRAWTPSAVWPRTAEIRLRIGIGPGW